MPKPIQVDLLNPHTADEISGRMIEKLPKAAFCDVLDVALALDVSKTHVYQLLEAGRISGLNIGVMERPYWRIDRQSVVTFLRNRAQGL